MPQSIVIVGGGVIGMEFAGLFNTLGSKVSVIEMATEILPPVDSEIAAMLHAEYKKQGIDFFVGAKVTELQNNKVLFIDNQGNEQSIDTEKILSNYSLQILWMDAYSYAHQLEACMYVGGEKQSDGSLKAWSDYSPEQIGRAHV